MRIDTTIIRTVGYIKKRWNREIKPCPTYPKDVEPTRTAALVIEAGMINGTKIQGK